MSTWRMSRGDRCPASTMRCGFVLLLAVTLFGVCQVPHALAQTSIYSIISSNPDLSILKAAVDAGGSSGVYALIKDATRAYTFFAPNNAAFAVMFNELGLNQTQLLSARDALSVLVGSHLVTQAVQLTSIPDGPFNLTRSPYRNRKVAYRNGTALTVTALGSTANVVQADIPTQAGYVNVIDKPLYNFYVTVADALAQLPNTTTLKTAVAAAGLSSMLADPRTSVTLFAPTDAAFASTLAANNLTMEALLANTTLLRDVLSFHILQTAVPAANFPTSPDAFLTLRNTLLPTRTRVIRVILTPYLGYDVNVSAEDGHYDIPVGLPYTNSTIITVPRSVVHEVDGALLPFPQTYPTIGAALQARNRTVLYNAILTEGTYASILTQPFTGTLFAPSDSALTRSKIQGLTGSQLLSNTAVLKALLETHIIRDRAYFDQDLGNMNTARLQTVNGETLTVQAPVPVRFASARTISTMEPGALSVNGGAASVVLLGDLPLVPSTLQYGDPPPSPSPAPSPSPGAATAAAPSALLLLWSVLGAGLLAALHM